MSGKPLSEQVKELSLKWEILAAALELSVASLREGVPPSEDLLASLQEVRADYQKLSSTIVEASAGRRLDVCACAPATLKELAAAADIFERQTRSSEEEMRQISAILARARQIRATSEVVAEVTHDLRDQIASVEASVLAQEDEGSINRTSLLQGTHPLCHLLRLIEEGDSLLDGEYEEIEANVEQAFGRKCRIAATRGHLTTAPPENMPPSTCVTPLPTGPTPEPHKMPLQPASSPAVSATQSRRPFEPSTQPSITKTPKSPRFSPLLAEAVRRTAPRFAMDPPCQPESSIPPAPTTGPEVEGTDLPLIPQPASPPVPSNVPAEPDSLANTLTNGPPRDGNADADSLPSSIATSDVANASRLGPPVSAVSPHMAAAEMARRLAGPPACGDSADLEMLAWRLLADDRSGAAYQLLQCIESAFPEALPTLSSNMVHALLLSSAVGAATGQVVDELATITPTLHADGNAAPRGNRPLSPIDATILLLALAMIRPALLAPASGAGAVLKNIPAEVLPLGTLVQVRNAVDSYVNQGVEVSPAVLKGVQEHVRWRSAVDAHQRRCAAWLFQARQATIIYAPSTDVWRQWLRPKGALGIAFMVIAEGAASQPIREALKLFNEVAEVRHLIERTDRQLRERGAARRPIDARAITALCNHARDACSLLKEWLVLHEQEPGEVNNYRYQKAEACRVSLMRGLDKLRDEITAIHGGQVHVIAATQTALRLLAGTRGLFDPNLSTELGSKTPRCILNAEFLHVPGLALDEAWKPRLPAAQLLGRLLEHIATGDSDWRKAFEVNSERRDHGRTQNIIEVLDQSPGGQELAEELRGLRDERMAECRDQLVARIKGMRTEIARAVVYNLVNDATQGELNARVDAISPDDVLDFAAADQELDEVRQVIQNRLKIRIGEVRERLAKKSGVIPPQIEERIEACLARGEFLTAGEYIDRVEHGHGVLDSAPESDADSFSAFFPDFLRNIHNHLERHRPTVQRMCQDIADRRDIGPLSLSGLSADVAAVASRAISTWFDLKERHGPVERRFQAFCEWLGLRDLEVVSRSTSSQTAVRCFDVTAHPVADRESCRIPQYGSLANGHYRFVCVWTRLAESDLLEVAGQHGQSHPTILLHFGGMTEQRRRDVARLCRQRHRTVLIIDDYLMLFACSRAAGSRFDCVLRLAMPFAHADPYTTSAGLVPVEVFYGRSRERESIWDPLGTSLVYGGRQLGKTALLRDVERRYHDREQGQIVRWIDLKVEGIGTHRPLEDVWRVLGGTFADDCGFPRNLTREVLCKRIREWLDASRSRRVLLLLDEADRFLEAEAIAQYPDLLELRRLMDQTARRFKVVFAGLHNVQRTARDVNTPLAHLGTPLCIGPLLSESESREALALITQPLEMLGYRFESLDPPMYILSCTNSYPSLIQLFCKQLLEHLTNPQRVTFDPQRTPPYIITARQVEHAYTDENLRQEILKRFTWTLDLDLRYRLIALIIAWLSIVERESGALALGFAPERIHKEALEWWAMGFQGDNTLAGFRTILEEMIGLGLLRQTDSQHYALRSSNVLNLLGSQHEIEKGLDDVAMRPPPQPYQPSLFRRAGAGDRWLRSPLTNDDESRLLAAANGVSLLFASRLGGRADLSAFLRQAAGEGKVVDMPPKLDLGGFVRRLGELIKDPGDGTTLVLVGPECGWGEAWVRDAVEFAQKRRSLSHFFRVLFVGDAGGAWTWTTRDADTAAAISRYGLVEWSLRPWDRFIVDQWFDDTAQGQVGRDSLDQLIGLTGGWGGLMHHFVTLCGRQPTKWHEALATFKAQSAEMLRESALEDLVLPARPVLKAMADYRDPINLSDLAALLGNVSRETLEAVVRWSHLLNFARVTDRDQFVLDPLVAVVVRDGM